MFEIAGLDDCDDRPENLLLEAIHVLGDIGVDVRPHVYALTSIALEVLRLVVVGNAPFAPKFRGSASIAHLDSLEEICGVFFRQHGSIEDSIMTH